MMRSLLGVLIAALAAVSCAKGAPTCPPGTAQTPAGLCLTTCQSDNDCLLGERCASNRCVSNALTDGGTEVDGGAGAATLSAAEIDFGALIAGGTARQELTFSNRTTSPVEVDVASAAPAGFEIDRKGQTFPLSLTPGGTAIIEVLFHGPTTPGAAQGDLGVALCSSGCSGSVRLRGESVSRTLSCSGTTLDFGITAAQTASTKQAVCQNLTDYPLEIQDWRTEGGAAFSTVSAPQTLGRRDSLSIDVRFQAPANGHYEDRVSIQLSQAGAAQSETLKLSGDAGGPDLGCDASLDFGNVAPGTTTTLSFGCTSRGTEAISVANISVGRADLTAVALDRNGRPRASPFALSPGEMVQIQVTWTPTQMGALDSSVILDSNDPDQPSTTVIVRGNVTGAVGCQLEMGAAIDFGLNPRGSPHDVLFPITNIGTMACPVSASNPPGAAFRLPGTNSFLINPGRRALLTVRANLQSTGPTSSTLRITAPDGDRQIALSAVGGELPVMIRPFPSLGFGPIPMGCGEPSRRTVSVVELNGTPLSVQGSISGDPDFSAPQMSAPLPPYGRTLELVELRPTSNDQRVGRLRLEVGGAAIYVELSGVGRTVGTITATVPARPATAPTDILFVIDGSPAGAEIRNNLSQAMQTLIPALEDSGEAYRVGLAIAGGRGALATKIERGTPNGADLLSAAILNLQSTSDFTVLSDVLSAVRDPAVMGLPGPPVFVRPNAQLAVVLALSQDDVSTGLVEELIAPLRDRAFGLPWGVRVHSYSGGINGCANASSSDYPPTPRLALAARKTGGSELSACQRSMQFTEPFAATLLRPITDVIELPSQPAPGSVTARVGGALRSSSDFYVDVGSARVAFRPANAPEPGEVVQLTFAPRCPSPHPICGNGSTDPFEQCDDHNTVDTDDCPSTCFRAACGDGAVRAGVEACDDGNLDDGDGCTTLCTLTGASWLVTTSAAPPVDPFPRSPRNLTDDSIVAEPPTVGFRFFGVPVGNAYVSSNGFISFLDTGGASFPISTPLGSPNPPSGLIAWWWDDLSPPSEAGTPGYSFASYNARGETIASFLFDLRHGLAFTRDSLAAEVRLHGATNDLEVIYRELGSAPGIGSPFSATVGLESVDGRQTVQPLTCLLGCSAGDWPASRAFRFTPN